MASSTSTTRISTSSSQPPTNPATRPINVADDQADADGEQRGAQRQRGAVHDAGEQVAAELVGAEQVRPRRGLQLRRGFVASGSPDVSSRGHERGDDDEHDPDRGQHAARAGGRRARSGPPRTARRSRRRGRRPIGDDRRRCDAVDLRRERADAQDVERSCAVATATAMRATAGDPRVEQRVEQVDDEVDDDEHAAPNSTRPCTTGMSWAPTAAAVSRPSPLRENTVSMTTDAGQQLRRRSARPSSAPAARRCAARGGAGPGPAGALGAGGVDVRLAAAWCAGSWTSTWAIERARRDRQRDRPAARCCASPRCRPPGTTSSRTRTAARASARARTTGWRRRAAAGRAAALDSQLAAGAGGDERQPRRRRRPRARAPAAVICAVGGIASAMIDVTCAAALQRPAEVAVHDAAELVDVLHRRAAGRARTGGAAASSCSGVTEVSPPASSCTGSLGSAYSTTNDTVKAAHSTNSGLADPAHGVAADRPTLLRSRHVATVTWNT